MDYKIPVSVVDFQSVTCICHSLTVTHGVLSAKHQRDQFDWESNLPTLQTYDQNKAVMLNLSCMQLSLNHALCLVLKKCVRKSVPVMYCVCVGELHFLSSFNNWHHF